MIRNLESIPCPQARICEHLRKWPSGRACERAEEIRAGTWLAREVSWVFLLSASARLCLFGYRCRLRAVKRIGNPPRHAISGRNQHRIAAPDIVALGDAAPGVAEQLGNR